MVWIPAFAGMTANCRCFSKLYRVLHLFLASSFLRTQESSVFIKSNAKEFHSECGPLLIEKLFEPGTNADMGQKAAWLGARQPLVRRHLEPRLSGKVSNWRGREIPIGAISGTGRSLTAAQGAYGLTSAQQARARAVARGLSLRQVRRISRVRFARDDVLGYVPGPYPHMCQVQTVSLLAAVVTVNLLAAGWLVPL